MKRKILPLIIFLLIMFSGCGGPAAANPDSLFHFPGLSWGMSPEEVKAALPIQDGEIEESPFSSMGITLAVSSWEEAQGSPGY